MTPDELLAALEKAGIKRSRSTLNGWVRAGLVRAPFRKGAGRGAGSVSLYDPEALGEAAAAAVLLDAGVSPEEVAKIRALASAEYDLDGLLSQLNMGPEPEIPWAMLALGLVGRQVAVPRGLLYLWQREGAVASAGGVTYGSLRRALNVHLWVLVRDRVNAGLPAVSKDEASGILVLKRTPEGRYRLEARW